MDADETTFVAGPVRITLEYRSDAPGDQGLCLRVWETAGGGDEILRFDCFDNAPHYHYGPARDDERLMLDTTADGDPLAWTLERFRRGRLPAMVERAGYASVAAGLDESVLQALLPRIEERARAIVARR